jgi:hypothetical protein
MTYELPLVAPACVLQRLAQPRKSGRIIVHDSRLFQPLHLP